MQMIAAEIVAGVVLATQFSKYGSVLPNDVSIGVLVVICVFIAGFAWSWGVSGLTVICIHVTLCNTSCSVQPAHSAA